MHIQNFWQENISRGVVLTEFFPIFGKKYTRINFVNQLTSDSAMIDKPTLVLGASPNPDRFSNIAIRKLVTYHHTVYAVGLREGNVQGIQIIKSFPDLKGIHTITLYVGPKNQSYYIDYILKIHPVRVIFNPGTENPEFEGQLRILGIEAVRGCTLIMLGNGTF